MEENKKEYWNDKYWKENIKSNQMDFIKDNWMEKYKNEICNYIKKVKN